MAEAVRRVGVEEHEASSAHRFESASRADRFG